MTALAITSRSNSRGFTLIEVLMAMLVLTVGLLGLLQALQLGYRQSLRDRVREEAVQLAEEQVHDRRREPFKKIADFKSEIRKKVGRGEVPFDVVGVVHEVGSAARPVKKLRVAVSWTVNGERFNHEIFTLRTRRSDEQE